MTLREIIQRLENKWVALIFSLLALIIFYNVNKSQWGVIFTILLAYLIADVVKSTLIRGENGIIQFPFLGITQTQHEGHGYLIFLIYIIAGTLLSVWVGDYIKINFIETLTDWQSWFVPNLIIVILVYIDFHITFRRR